MPSLGGAISCLDGANVRLENIEIYGSMANLGAGIAINDSDPILTTVSIVDVEARNRGGGIYLSNSSSKLTNVTLTDNNAYDFGGGIYMTNSSPEISYTELSNNYANKGAGIYSDYSEPKLLFNVIHSNSSFNKGGGIYSSNSQLNISNITLWNNQAIVSGNGFYLHNSKGQFLNSILWDNGDVQGELKSTQNSNFIKFAYSCIMNDEEGIDVTSNGYVYFYDSITSDNPEFLSISGIINLGLDDDSPYIDGGVVSYDFGNSTILSTPITEYEGNNPDIGGIETGYVLLDVDVDIKTFTIDKPYPNPFNPVVGFNYRINEKISDVKIDVYDITGTLVESLYNGKQIIGSYSIKWNASERTSGMYMISVIVDNKKQVNKVLLIK